MKNRHKSDGLLILLFGCLLFALGTVGMARSTTASAIDFKAVYYSARSLLHHVDPYQEANLRGIYQQEGGDRLTDQDYTRRLVILCINLPSAFIVFLPFAMLPWAVAHVLWIAFIAACMLAAAYLIWESASADAPRLAGLLLFLLLVTSLVLVDVANTAGVVVGLCVIGAWCFLRDRLVPLGVGCLALCLIVKPHDAGFIWLYFLLIGGRQRKRAWVTLLVAVLLALPGTVWTTSIAPHWVHELHSNLSVTSSRGDVNDPGPQSLSRNTADSIIDLQTVVSVFTDNPHIYNPVAFLICLPLIAAWIWRSARGSHTAEDGWIALASIAALTMLPLYHRQDDARLLLLAVPACAILWSRGGKRAWWAVSLTALAILVNGDLPTLGRIALFREALESAQGFTGGLVTVFVARPVPIVLLALGSFYLWLYIRSGGAGAPAAGNPPTPEIPGPGKQRSLRG